MPGSDGIFASARVIALLTMCSRLLGLLREVVFSYYFSTTGLLSAFRIAFMVPNLARRLFGEGAISAAMIPTLTESLQRSGEEASRRFVGSILVTLAAFLVAGVLAAEAVIAVWLTFHDDPSLRMAAILAPYMICICVAAVVGGVLNVRRHFATPAALPIILNVAVIAAAAGAASAGLRGTALMHVVCVGVLAAGAVQLGASLVALRAVSFFPIFELRRRDPYVRTVFVLMLPMVLGLSAVQINTLFDYLIAYLFIREDGERVGPAVLGYAHYLYQLPLGVFGISIATAVFPELSRRAAAGDGGGLARVACKGLRLALFISLPASVGLMFVAEPLVATLYERGEFDARATGRVAATLLFYAIGLGAYFVQHVLVRVFYAMHDSRTPARVAARTVAVNLFLNLVLVFVMEERGLALSTAVCAAMQVVWLLRRLRGLLPEFHVRDIAAPAAKSLAATAVMAGTLALLATAELPGRSALFRLAVLLVMGVAAYSAAARLLCAEELGAFLRRRPNTDSFK